MAASKLPDVLFIGIVGGDSGWAETEFLASVSTHDFDLVVWDPNWLGIPKGNDVARMADGTVLLDYQRSLPFTTALNRRWKEFESLVANGGDIVVFAAPEVRFVITESDGSRNRISGWDFLPVEVRNLAPASGKKIEIVGTDPIAEFLRENRAQVTFQATFDAYEHEGWTVLAKTSNTGEIVAAVYTPAEGGGRLIVLPWMKHEFGSNVTRSGQRVFDPRTPDFVGFWKPLLDAISAPEIPETDAPDWIDDYTTASERDAFSIVEAETRVIAEATDRLGTAAGNLKAARLPKRLLYATGPELESACLDALVALGGTPLEVEPNRADLLIDFGTWTAVVEVKGVTGSASEANAAQLEKWASEHVATVPNLKSILLVNAFREVDPGKRKAVFPNQMIPYSTKRDHLLMTTSQLLVIVAGVADGSREVRLVLEELRTTIGVLSGYPLSELTAASSE